LLKTTYFLLIHINKKVKPWSKDKKELNLLKLPTIVGVLNLERLYGKVLLIMAKLYINQLYNKLVNTPRKTNFFSHVIGFGVLTMLFALRMVTKSIVVLPTTYLP